METAVYTSARERIAATTPEDIALMSSSVARVSRTRRNARERTPARKEAHREYSHSEKGREKARIREKRYRDKHPEKGREKIDRWEAAHPGNKAARNKKWRQAHPDRVRAHNKAYREKHKNDPAFRAKQNAYMREYRKRKKAQKQQEVQFVGI